MKVAVIGCGLRTPLLLSGLMTSGKLPDEIVLYDLDPEQAHLMAALGAQSAPDSPTRLRVAATPEDAISGSSYVISSIRPGGMEARARDERVSLEHGYAGQETIGPAGFAMAWRSIPAVLHYAKLVEKLAAQAWLINFTNPAGLVTQAVRSASSVRVVGICDTPAELFFRIALAFGVEPNQVQCEYFGLNHLGFVSKVIIAGQDRTAELLQDDARLNSLYPAPLFPPELIRHIRLVPTEYVFFYFRPSLALANQRAVGKTRGEELVDMNRDFHDAVSAACHKDGPAAGLQVYARYLNHRNASYLQLEGGGTSAFAHGPPNWDPFAAVTGYHRIAVQTIQALAGTEPADMVLNISNEGAVAHLQHSDVVETHCQIGPSGITRLPQQVIPSSVLGLIESTKAYERAVVQAALEGDSTKAIWALAQNPLVRDWDAATTLVHALLN